LKRKTLKSNVRKICVPEIKHLLLEVSSYILFVQKKAKIATKNENKLLACKIFLKFSINDYLNTMREVMLLIFLTRTFKIITTFSDIMVKNILDELTVN